MPNLDKLADKVDKLLEKDEKVDSDMLAVAKRILQMKKNIVSDEMKEMTIKQLEICSYINEKGKRIIDTSLLRRILKNIEDEVNGV